MILFCFAGGFAGNIGHDPHILYTLSAVQVLALLDKLNVLDVDKVSNCILVVFGHWTSKFVTKFVLCRGQTIFTKNSHDNYVFFRVYVNTYLITCLYNLFGRILFIF